MKFLKTKHFGPVKASVLWPTECLSNGGSKRPESRVVGCDGIEQTKRLERTRSQPVASCFIPSFWEVMDSRALCRCSWAFRTSTPTYAHDPEREQKEPQQFPARNAPERRHIQSSFHKFASHSNFTPSDGVSAIVRWDAFGSPRGCGRGLKNDGRGDPRPRPRESQKRASSPASLPRHAQRRKCARCSLA
jgi:hypothetical protein